MNKKTKFFIFLFGVVFLYQSGKWGYGQAAQAYFDYKCENYAGEFIYRTVQNVEGLYQMRLRDPRNYIDRMRKGDIPEDPYGHTDWESQRPWTMFVEEPYSNYLYFETTKGPDLKDYDLRRPKRFAFRPVYTDQEYWIYYGRSHTNKTLMQAKQTSSIKSQHGFTWKEIRNKWDNFFGVWGGELIVKELNNEETLAIKRGYFFQNKIGNKGGICPRGKDGKMTYKFISKVLIPAKVKKELDDVK